MNYFQRLQISEWQQFREIDIQFHERVTILTGANASGKTTLLNLLGQHTGWEVPSLAIPRLSTIEGVVRFFARIFSGRENKEEHIGTLTYTSGRLTQLRVPKSSTAQYLVTIASKDNVPCFFVPSHRSVYRYQPVTQIPTARSNKDQAFQRVWNSTRGRYFGGSEIPSSYHMKELLISWNIFGLGNRDMLPDDELLSFYEGFQESLKKVLPPTLGFRRFSILNLELVLECDSGNFTIDGASGGLSTLIDLTWQIFMFSSQAKSGFTVLIDEVENHLHPTMQRRMLNDFLAAFPQVRFVVSTHSPLIVNSVRDCAVYALRYDSEQTVRSQRLDMVGQARTATQILDEVLGVSSTMPPWVEEELDLIISGFSSGPMNEQEFSNLRRKMIGLGLGDYLPHTLGKILDVREK